MTRPDLEPASPEQLASYRAAPLFQISPAKLALLSVCTLGIYQFYWSLRQWRSVHRREQANLSPIVRALLAPCFGFSLFRRIQASSASLGVPATWPAFTLGAAYLLLSFAWLAPVDPIWCLAELSVVPLLFVQRSVNVLNAAVAPEQPRNDKFSEAERALILLGLLLQGFLFWSWLQMRELMSIMQSM